MRPRDVGAFIALRATWVVWQRRVGRVGDVAGGCPGCLARRQTDRDDLSPLVTPGLAPDCAAGALPPGYAGHTGGTAASFYDSAIAAGPRKLTGGPAVVPATRRIRRLVRGVLLVHCPETAGWLRPRLGRGIGRRTPAAVAGAPRRSAPTHPCVAATLVRRTSSRTTSGSLFAGSAGAGTGYSAANGYGADQSSVGPQITGAGPSLHAVYCLSPVR